MRGKIYTLSELERALPLIRAVVSDVVAGYGSLKNALLRLGMHGRAPSLTDTDLLRELPWDVRDLIDELRGCIDELSEIGVFLKDPELGLVEAYGEQGGQIVYFSWKPGEERVRFWHGLFGSHRERRPVLAMA